MRIPTRDHGSSNRNSGNAIPIRRVPPRTNQQGSGSPTQPVVMAWMANLVVLAFLVALYGPAIHFHRLDERDFGEFSVRTLFHDKNLSSATARRKSARLLEQQRQAGEVSAVEQEPSSSLFELGLNSAGNPTYFHEKCRSQTAAEKSTVIDVESGGSTPDMTTNGTNSSLLSSEETTREIIDMRILNRELPFEDKDGGVWKQGWNVEPYQGNITVFVMPHSHCDPGWIKTFDEYFRTQTKNILSTVHASLKKDGRRKFIWAEISYFEWWWREQPTNVQEEMRTLIANKQFEFVTGGWVMPDEANSVRYALEVQLQEGHDWLNDTFGEDVIPKYGWSIDPFGYSPTMAAVLKDYGFKGMLIQRVHYAIKKEFAWKRTLEFDWRQTWDEDGSHDIFTHLMPFYSYDVPHTCGPEPAVCCQFDFARLGKKFGGCPWKKEPKAIDNRNVAERSRLIVDQYRKKASLYRSNVVMQPLGDDFRYQSVEEAEKQYTNYQKIMDYVNDQMPGVNMKFGTLSDYFEAAMGTFQPPVLKGSFFTYSDREEDYWSGYFTSRVFDKALDRRLEAALYAATTMGATRDEMRNPRRALSLFQHHDGVTGTAKNHVVQDYAKRMFDGINFVQQWMASRLDGAVVGNSTKPPEPCWIQGAPRELGRNLCHPDKPVFLYNPLNTPQKWCGKWVARRETKMARLTCDGATGTGQTQLRFDSKTGLVVHPFKEEWMVWHVKKGGAYLFFPDKAEPFGGNLQIEDGGFRVTTPSWSRTVVEYDAGVFDFFYDTNLQENNQEWFVRYTSGVENGGEFHTDLNGFNFDTHDYRKDLPIQAQVFPMPTLASIEDNITRFTVLSEHARGSASLQDGMIDVWLDRRLGQDDARGLAQGVNDNVRTQSRLRVVMESNFERSKHDFKPTSWCQRMWDEINHPLEIFGTQLLPSQLERNRESLSRLIIPPPASHNPENVAVKRNEKERKAVQRNRRNMQRNAAENGFPVVSKNARNAINARNAGGLRRFGAKG